MIRSPLFSTKIIRIDWSNIYSNYHDWYGLLRLIFSIQLNRAISGHDSTAVTTLKPIERTWNMWRHAINTHNITWHAIVLITHDCCDVIIIQIPCSALAWWRHQMETFSALLATCAGNSPLPGEFHTCGALMFSLICAWIKGWVNNGEAGDLRR